MNEVRETLPELPNARKQRFISTYYLPQADAEILTSSKSLADYFEACVELFPTPKTVSNWVMGELLRELHASGVSANESAISPERLAKLLSLVEQGAISLKVAREIFPELYASGKDPEGVIQEKGLSQVSDEEALMTFVQEVISQNPEQVGQYKGGKEAVLGFFVGQVDESLKREGQSWESERITQNGIVKRTLMGVLNNSITFRIAVCLG